MVIVVLRHASREQVPSELEEFDERSAPLSKSGIRQARKLGKQLRKWGIKPDVYYASCFTHATQTAKVLRTELASASARIIQLCSLTPHYQGPRAFRDTKRVWTGLDILISIDKESKCKGQDMRKKKTIAMILHKPRLEQLLAGMTSQDEGTFRDLDYASGVCLKAESFDSLLQGRVLESATLSSQTKKEPG